MSCHQMPRSSTTCGHFGHRRKEGAEERQSRARARFWSGALVVFNFGAVRKKREEREGGKGGTKELDGSGDESAASIPSLNEKFLKKKGKRISLRGGRRNRALIFSRKK